ncbi:MAG: YeiH family protein [Cognatishimia sp.]
MISFYKAKLDPYSKGLFLAIVIAAASTFLSEHYGAPVMLFALLIGMAFHFLHEDGRCVTGIDFASKTLLRFGVGLMGLRLTVADVVDLGVAPIGAIVGFVLATLGLGVVLSFRLGRQTAFGLLAGGSVAICGASAALAITSVLPQSRDREQDTLFVVIGVTVLSTIAMICYPLLFGALGLNALESGFLVGATIHDVAQVVGAGYSISEEAGVIATYVKMLRVALLPVVLLVIMIGFREGQTQRLSIPWFLVMFIALAVLANLNILPAALLQALQNLSSWCLVVAISALGVKTSLAHIVKVDPRYSAILVIETLFLLSIALVYTIWIGI